MKGRQIKELYTIVGNGKVERLHNCTWRPELVSFLEWRSWDLLWEKGLSIQGPRTCLKGLGPDFLSFLPLKPRFFNHWQSCFREIVRCTIKKQINKEIKKQNMLFQPVRHTL